MILLIIVFSKFLYLRKNLCHEALAILNKKYPRLQENVRVQLAKLVSLPCAVHFQLCMYNLKFVLPVVVFCAAL